MNEKLEGWLVIISALLLTTVFPVLLISNYDSHTETKTIKATVTDKEYVESDIDFGYHFSAWKMKYRWKFGETPEEYNVTVKYNDIIKVIDSERLYNKVEIGDKVELKLVTITDKEGKIKDQYISIFSDY